MNDFPTYKINFFPESPEYFVGQYLNSPNERRKLSNTERKILRKNRKIRRIRVRQARNS